ncbi:MAG: hypothetical protein MI976_02875 [Pseudomonadales bacterium]|nr:hypothetical protein [Pseudomonadales bacterium]
MTKIQKGLLLSLLLLLAAGCKEKVDQLEVGSKLVCATHNSYVSCWGKDAEFSANFRNGWTYKLSYIKKQFIDPKVAVGYEHFCVLDQEAVECHYYNRPDVIEVPELSNPYEIAAGYDYSCALDDTGVVCWGETLYLDELPEVLQSPYNLVAGYRHVCVQDEFGFYCDGFTFMGDGDPSPPVSIDNPTAVTTSPDSTITCALQGQWQCWASSNVDDASFFFDAPTADWVAPGMQQTCALDGNDVSCIGFGVLGPAGAPVPENLIDPSQLGVAGAHACVVARNGVRCWSPAAIISPINVPPYL